MAAEAPADGADPEPSPSGGRPPLELRISAPARAESARAIRRRITQWLDDWQWRPDDRDDVILAVDEAVANVVDHAYRLEPGPGAVLVDARVVVGRLDQHLVVSISDHGRWRPLPADPGYRGRGLQMMGSCMAQLDIDRSGAGTTVTMTSTPVAELRPDPA